MTAPTNECLCFVVIVVSSLTDHIYSKADMLDWMASGDPEDWGDESFTLNEVVASEGVAYAWTTIANTDE